MTEAFKNIFSNGWMTLASIFTVMASLLVLGVFMVLSLNLNSIVGDLQGDYEIIAVVDDKISDDGLSAVCKDIEAIENVNDAALSAKDERMENLKENFGNNADLLDRYKDDNPLRNWYKITLADLTRSSETIDKISQVDGVVKVIQNETAINNLINIANYIRQFSIWIIVALAIVSIFIIANTIKLTVYTRRKEINIMKFVGATDWFIRWPFIIEGILIGIVGAALSIGLVLLCYNVLLGVVQNLGIIFISLKPFSEILSIVLSGSLSLGAVLGGVGSLIAVRKHLNV